ncbi:stimulus-sensing domain-containing protein [Ferruginivarius sediminum]|uniref:histidine kinase n=1 Tax=Ferruginivarius sediminum TaxID=2661937 RepID=A0A369T4T9_9PROT|nr:stimulus-sensing domain-containing protein [Ferruginivarius sediminum]RDD60339.1 HAMP domain-containing protein [Ferruginivarius sediminum]
MPAERVGEAGQQPSHGETEARRRSARLSRTRSIRRAWRSPLTRRILAVNVLVLAIPVLGLLHLQQYKDSLVQAELDALETQGRAFAATLANSAVVVTQSGEEKLLREGTRHAMRVLLSNSQTRARLFAPKGELIADSFVLTGPGGQVKVEELPPPETVDPVSRLVNNIYDWLVLRAPSLRDLPAYTESPAQRAVDYREVERALAGESASQVRRDRRGGLVLSVAMPVQRYRQVLGALMLSKDGSDIEAAVRERRFDILIVFAVALGVTVLLSIYLAGTIARPMRRLAEAADRVRRARGRQVEIPDLSRRDDEIGDLSAALKEMTEALWDRLDAIERFAADVAHEIKNPLTSVRSAVETVARVDDPAQQKKLMGIILDDVQRLDRLISDISDASRLDAELSRAEASPVDTSRLLDALVEVQRATFEEDGGPRFVLHLPRQDDGTLDPLTVPGLEGRLAQVFRNLLSNAATFTPADGEVRVTARRQDNCVEIVVDDDGPGIPEGKLAAIFDRFYTQRPESEKFGTHSGLGLSISRQIVQAHGGTITAENRHDDSGRIAGARFTVRLPGD